MVKRYLKSIMLMLCIILMFSSNIGLYAYGENINDKQIISQELLMKLNSEDDFYDVMIYFKEDINLQEIESKAKMIDTDESDELKKRKLIIGELEELALASQNKLSEYLEEEKQNGNVKEYTNFFIVNSIHLVAKKSVIVALDRYDNIDSIDINETIVQEKPIIEKAPRRAKRSTDEIEWNIKAINADMVWEKGIKGQGVVVGILDTAVDMEHSALKKKFRGYNPDTDTITYEGHYKDFVTNHEKPNSNTDVEHGTHCMGIILGSEENENGKYNMIGVAPEAKFISARIFGDRGESTADGVLRAAEWMLKPDGNAENAPDIINNSWGGEGGNYPNSKWFEGAVKKWRAAGILPVFASGNQLPGESAPGPYSIVTPASYEDAFSVGATDKYGNLASFSKRGPSPLGVSEYKPEVTAPGVTVRSSVRGGYLYMSGTSMAAPHVSGMAALIKSYRSDISEIELRELIKKTATPKTDDYYTTSPNHGYGYGIINAYDAINQLDNIGNAKITGKVMSGGNPVQAEIRIKQTNRFVKSDATSGKYIIRHTAGDIDLICTAYGYETVEKRVSLSKDVDMEVDFDLIKKATSKLDITVKDSQGKTIENAYVRLVEDSNIGIEKTDSVGKVELNPYYGEYTLRVFKDNYVVDERKIQVNSNQTQSFDIILSLKDENKYIEEEMIFDTNNMNKYAEMNFGIGRGLGQFSGGAVKFEPMSGSTIKSCEVVFFEEGVDSKIKQARVGVVKTDERGRFEFILSPIEFEFTPGKAKTISLEEYQIKPDGAYYIVVLMSKEKASSFIIGADKNGDRNNSFVFRDGNFIPIEKEFEFGALMIRSTVIYDKSTQDIQTSVNPPILNPISPSDEKITGSAEKGQTVNLEFVGGTRLSKKIEQEDGNFEIELTKKLRVGEEIKAYSKNARGLKSKTVTKIVNTDKKDFEENISLAKEQIKDDSSLEQSKKEELTKIVVKAEELKITISEYEAGDDISSERIVELQEEINKITDELKAFILNLIPDKKVLYELIESVEREINEIWKSSSAGENVPDTKYWISSGDWRKFENKLERARWEYKRYNSNEQNTKDAIENLKKAKEEFVAKKQLGQERMIDISTIEDGFYIAKDEKDLSRDLKVSIEVRDKKIIDIKIEGLDETIRTKIEQDGFFGRIINENRLDVNRTEKAREDCDAIIRTMLEALKKGPVTPKIDVSNLINAINTAQNILDFYPVSQDGSDISADRQWASQTSYEEFKNVIQNAKTLSEQDDITETQRDEQIKLIEEATKLFIDALQNGKKQEEIIDDTPSTPDIQDMTEGEKTVTIILKDDTKAGDTIILEVVGKENKEYIILESDITEKKVYMELSNALAYGDVVKVAIKNKAGIKSAYAQKTVSNNQEEKGLLIYPFRDEVLLNKTSYTTSVMLEMADEESLKIKVVNMPSGLNFDENTRQISGLIDVEFNANEEIKKYLCVVIAEDKNSRDRKIINFTILRDTDSDSIADTIDEDDDNDSFRDEEELRLGSNPKDSSIIPQEIKEQASVENVKEGDDKIVIKSYKNAQKIRIILPDGNIFELSKDMQNLWKSSDSRNITQNEDTLEISLEAEKIIAGKKIYVSIFENGKTVTHSITIDKKEIEIPKEEPKKEEPKKEEPKKQEENKGSSGGGSGGSSSSGGGGGGSAISTPKPKVEEVKKKPETIPDKKIDEKTKIEKEKEIFEKVAEIEKRIDDLPKDYNMKKAISIVIDKGLMKGTKEGKFEPNKNLSRAMFVTILAQMSKDDMSEIKTQKFKDIKNTAWYSKAANWALENKLMAGTGNKSFSANQNLSYEQVATVLQRYFDYKNIKLDKKKEVSKEIQEKLKTNKNSKNIYTMLEYEIFDENDKKIFEDKSEITRQEMANILARLIEKLEEKQ